MQNTTRPTVVALESITSEILFHVSGGCGKKCPPPPPPAPAPAPAPITQVLQLQMPQQLQPQPQFQPQQVASGPEVSTSVSINGQPA
jgi:hypothetical protein